MEKFNKSTSKQRKEVAGPIRNKSRTKARLLSGVGKLICECGHHGLTITAITKYTKQNAKLMYLYFGTVENLIETYIREQQFWLRLTILQSKISNGQGRSPHAILVHRLNIHLKFLLKNKEFLALLIWEVGEKCRLLRTFTTEKEEYFSRFFFRETDRRASEVDLDLLDLVISSITHLCMYARQEILWMGLSLNRPDDYRRIVDKIASIILANK